MKLSPLELQKGTLYIVAVPIGNAKDITLRALETLKGVDRILAEDTRVLFHLLHRYQIKREGISSYHSYNEQEQIPSIVHGLKEALWSVALVSDAGTPLISDPGHLLIKELYQHKIPVVCIPGVSAITTALPLCGFPLENFYFVGFLSPKEGKRKHQLEKIRENKTVLVFYESPHRIFESLSAMKEIFGNKPAFLGRELTKIYETIYKGTLSEILEQVSSKNFVCKGEFVIIVNNRGDTRDSSKDLG